MSYCPNCNAEVSEEVAYCPTCGAALYEGGAPNPGRQPQSPGGGNQARGPGQPPANNSSYQQQGQGRYPQQPRAARSHQSVTRRRLLAAGGVGATLLAGGYFVFSSGSGRLSPVEVAKEFVSSLSEGDRERARQLTHSERSLSQILGLTTLAIGDELEIESTQLMEKNEDIARVQFTYTNLDTDYRDTDAYVLRRDDGKWRIWELENF